VLVGIIALAPTAAFAQGAPPSQPAEQSFCGVQVPIATAGELDLTQPADLGNNAQGIIDYSAVRGSIVHVSGPLMLVQLDVAGMGNAAPNHELAGNTMAVVQLPNDCDPGQFSVGTPVLAVGTPTDQGILQAVEVTPTG
jgi:hypothetical protein